MCLFDECNLVLHHGQDIGFVKNVSSVVAKNADLDFSCHPLIRPK